MKVKSLREIETIRETKKRDIIQSMIGSDGPNSCPTLNVMPGHLTFAEPMTVVNDTNQVQNYSVKIIDHDEEMLGGFGSSELVLVQDAAELNHWVAECKIKKPMKFGEITRRGYILLKPGQSIDLLFKFLTKREVSLSPTA